MNTYVLGILFITILGPQKLPVNLDVIVKIESQGRPKAYNRHTQARGIFQITPIVLKEWNQWHPEVHFHTEDLFDPKINAEIARWYLGVRIPEMLNYYHKPITIENVIISWNAGIKYVVLNDRIPDETKNFIEKYKRLNK